MKHQEVITWIPVEEVTDPGFYLIQFSNGFIPARFFFFQDGFSKPETDPYRNFSYPAKSGGKVGNITPMFASKAPAGSNLDESVSVDYSFSDSKSVVVSMELHDMAVEPIVLVDTGKIIRQPKYIFKRLGQDDFTLSAVPLEYDDVELFLKGAAAGIDVTITLKKA